MVKIRYLGDDGTKLRHNWVVTHPELATVLELQQRLLPLKRYVAQIEKIKFPIRKPSVDESGISPIFHN
jgi:hypothetical protein